MSTESMDNAKHAGSIIYFTLFITFFLKSLSNTNLEEISVAPLKINLQIFFFILSFTIIFAILSLCIPGLNTTKLIRSVYPIKLVIYIIVFSIVFSLLPINYYNLSKDELEKNQQSIVMYKMTIFLIVYVLLYTPFSKLIDITVEIIKNYVQKKLDSVDAPN